MDDMYLLFTSEQEDDLFQTTQDGLNLWESYLRATGGAINAGELSGMGLGLCGRGKSDNTRHKETYRGI